ncbi:MAG: diacylglycerol kinase family protein [Verrucomicrobiales bacterium]|nr:diacylglycerol kinase family protein [Verrucomicrobiales bacterium]
MAIQKPFSIAARLQSLRYAFCGLVILLRSQHNVWLHAIATIITVAVGFFFAISAVEWALLVLAISGVWVAEALNTAIEFLADATHPEIHPLIAKCKDVAAAGVLIAAGGAMLIGLLVFSHHLWERLSFLG